MLHYGEVAERPKRCGGWCVKDIEQFLPGFMSLFAWRRRMEFGFIRFLLLCTRYPCQVET